LARLELEVAIGTVVTRFAELRLAVLAEEIRWDYRLTAAGPESLPVLW
jgi:cytochrome P450